MEKPLPLSVTLRLDPDDAELVRRLVRARGNRSLQSTVVGVLREFERQQQDPARCSEDLLFRDRYFDLAETTEDLRRQTEKLLLRLDEAQALAGGVKRSKKKRRK